MTTEYIYNTIKRIINGKVNREPKCATYNEVVKEVIDDLRLALGQLMEEKRIKSRDSINDTLYYNIEKGEQND